MDIWSIWGSICHGCICILLCVRLIGCNSFAWIYGQLEGVHQPWVYVHSAVCKTYWVYWCSINLWSIGGWSLCQGYMCILLYVILLGFNSVPWIYGQFGGLGPSAMGICAFCYTWNLLGVIDLLGSMLNLGVHQPWVYVHSVKHETYWV